MADERDKQRAGASLLLNSLFEEKKLDPESMDTPTLEDILSSVPDLDETDDIGSSAMYLYLIDNILGRRESAIPVSLPFEQFASYDANDFDHDFSVTYKTYTPKRLEKTFSKFQAVFDYAQAFNDPSEYVHSMYAERRLKEAILALDKESSRIVDLITASGVSVSPKVITEYRNAFLNAKLAELAENTLSNLRYAVMTISNSAPRTVSDHEEYEPTDPNLVMTDYKNITNNEFPIKPLPTEAVNALRNYGNEWINKKVQYKLTSDDDRKTFATEGANSKLGINHYLKNRWRGEKNAGIDCTRFIFELFMGCDWALGADYTPTKYFDSNRFFVQIPEHLLAPGDVIVIQGFRPWLMSSQEGHYDGHAMLYVGGPKPEEAVLHSEATYGPHYSRVRIAREVYKNFGTSKTKYYRWCPIGESVARTQAAAMLPASFQEDQTDYMVSVNSGIDAADVKSAGDIISALTKLRDDAITPIISAIVNAARLDIQRTLVTDFRGKVTDLNISVTPGNSVFLPIAGEIAPLVQTTGGRQANVVATIQFNDQMELARMCLMFGATKAITPVVGMLYMARSIRAGSAEVPYRYMMRNEESRRLGEIAESLRGKTIKPELIEPMLITNPILNGLGMYEFFPSDIQIMTSPTGTNEYTAKITFNYINVRNRRLESLRREKVQIFRRSLPVLATLASAGMGASQKTVLTARENFLAKGGGVSMLYALTDILPVYVIYRVQAFLARMHELCHEKGETVLDLGSPQAKVLFAELPAFGTYCLDGDAQDSLHKTFASMNPTALMKGETFATETTPAITGLVLSFMTMNLGRGLTSTTNGAKTGEMIERARAGAPKAAAALGASTAASYGLMELMVDGQVGDGKSREPLVFNIPTLSPVLVFDLLKEFCYALGQGKAGEFIETISESAAGFFRNSTFTGYGMSLPTNIKVRKKDKKECSYDAVVITMTAPEKTVTSHGIDGGVFGPKIGSWTTGYTERVDDVKEAAQKALTDATAGVTPNPGALMYASALCIEYAVLRSYGNYRVYADGGYKNSLVTLDPVERTARLLTTQAALRDFASEALTALVISSGAAGIVYDAMIDFAGSGTDSFLTGRLDADGSGKMADWYDTKLPINADTLKLSAEQTEDLIAARDTAAKSMDQGMSDAARILKATDVTKEEFLGMVSDGSFTLLNNTDVGRGIGLAIGLVFATMYGIMVEPSKDKSESKYMFEQRYGITPKFFMTDIIKIANPDLKDRTLTMFAIGAGELVSYVSLAAIVVILTLLPITGPVAGIIGAIRIFFMVLDVAIAALDLMATAIKGAISYVITVGSFLRIGQWIYVQISQGIDQATACDLCLKTGIWLPSLADLGGEILDPTTTYFDYPAVRIGTTYASPDLYMSKLGGISSVLEEVVASVKTMTQLAAEDAGDLNVDNVRGMAEKFLQAAKDVSSRMASEFGQIVAKGISEKLGTLTDSEKKKYYAILPLLTKAFYLALGKDEMIHVVLAKTEKDIASASVVGFTIVLSAPGTGTGQGEYRITCYTPTDMSAFKDKCKPSIGTTSDPSFANLVQVMRYQQSYGFAPKPIREALESAIRNTGDLTKSGLDRNTAISFLTAAGNDILKEVGVFSASIIENEGTFSPITQNALPGTLGNLLFLSQTVGNCMRAVGKPGMAYYEENLKSISLYDLLDECRFRSSYLLPTYKVFFIEEDDEAYYMWDDLYSYSAIIGIAVTEEDDSALQTCQITATNIYGALTNIVTDSISSELYFLQGADDQTDAAAIMLKPGCKVRVQMGYSPTLRDEDAVFTGRITQITPGNVINITCEGHGSVFYTEMSKGNVTCLKGYYMPDEDKAAVELDHIVKPRSRLTRLIGELLSMLTAESSLSDYTINPDLAVTPTSEIKTTSRNYDDIIKNTVMTGLGDDFTNATGLDFKFYFNRQLMENVRIKAGDTDDTYANWLMALGSGVSTRIHEISETVADLFEAEPWVLYDETAWDAIQEMNLLLPGYRTVVRPYETRGTFVWGKDDTYYRFRRGTDISSVIPDRVISRLAELRNGFSFTGGEGMLKMVISLLETGDEQDAAAAAALVTFITYYTQLTYMAFVDQARAVYGHGENVCTPVDESLVMSNEFTQWDVEKAEKWLAYDFTPKGMERAIAEMTMCLNRWRKGLGLINEEASEHKDESGKADSTTSVESATSGTNTLMSKDPRRIVWYGAGKSWSATDTSTAEWHTGYIVKWVLFEQHATNFMEFMETIAFQYSRSYRRLSATHSVVSGVDIINNGIQLNSVPNTVAIHCPESGSDEEEVVTPSSNMKPFIVRAHYKLKPWVVKQHAAYFKNANVMPFSRPYAISTVAGSVLANSLSQMYGGQISLVGRPRMRAADRLIIYDEVNDFFGVVRVGKVTTKMNPQEGCITTVEPKLIIRSGGKVASSVLTMMTDIAGTALTLGLVGVMGYHFRKPMKSFFGRIQTKARYGNSKALRLASDAVDTVKGISRFPGRMAQGAKGLLTKVRTRFGKAVESAEKAGVGDEIAGILRSEEGKRFVQASSDYAAGLRTDVFVKTKDQVDGLSKEIITRMYKARGLEVEGITEEAVAHLSQTIREIAGRNVSGAMKTILKGRWTNEKDAARALGELTDAELKNLDDLLHNGITDSITTFVGKKKFGEADMKSSELKTILGEVFGSTSSRSEGMTSYLNAIRDGVKSNTTRYTEEMDKIAKAYAEKNPGASVESCRTALSLAYTESVLGWQTLWDDVMKAAKPAIKAATAYLIADSFISPVHDLTEMYLVTTTTADTLVMSPMWFRGEPFIAGLDGMDKTDAANAGLTDIFKARMSDIGEMFFHIDDSVDEALYRLTIEKANIQKNSDPKNATQDVLNSGNETHHD